MSESKPEVVQGRLGIESGDVTELNPGELKPHPKNTEIYGDTETVEELPETFVKSVREKGVLEPLVITDGKQIISGHRRWLAAKHVGLDRVPVRKTTFDDDLTEREALVEFNRQREKTPGQVVNEFKEMLAIEQERAKDREKEAGESAGKGSGNVSTPIGGTGKARDKAAEKVNADVSGRTLEKGLDVKEKAESGDETAQREWEKLQDGDTSFHRATGSVG
jgi:ParB-like chromosome segregation protein Spo0J